jgi:cytidylate kinase
LVTLLAEDDVVKRSATLSTDVSHVAERQMRTWAIGLQNQEELSKARPAQPLPQRVFPYVAVTREAGIDDGAVARALAARSNWKVLDRETLDHMADEQHWSRTALDFVDERTASWFNDTIGKWLDRQTVSQVEFVHRLARVVVLAAHHESMIFVGRGAQFVLPRDRGLTVRLVAPRKLRVQRLAHQLEIGEHEAERRLDEIDDGRADFIKRYFHRDVRDPHFYDLVINMEHLSSDAAAEMILHACKLRF